MNIRAQGPSDPYRAGLKLSAEGRHAEAIGRFEAALAARPDDTRVLFALGNTARALDMAEPAEAFYRRVLAAEPDRIEARVNLANLLREKDDPAGAAALLAPALARAPEVPELWLTLGSAHREMGDPAEAERHWREALTLRADYPAALGNLADLLADRGEIDEALALYGRALKRDGGNAQARLNRAILHFLKGDLKAGWRDYAARLKVPGKTPVRSHRLSAWTGGPLKKARLLVMAEQGVGDQIMFASAIPDLAGRAAESGAGIILECEPRLEPLFARSFPGVRIIASDMDAKGRVITARYDRLKAMGGANMAVDMGSVPRWLRADLSAFPAPHAYLVPDTQDRARWRDWLEAQGNGPSIGICWRSGKSGAARNLQYAPLDAWAEFLRDLNGEIVCVQYDATTEEIAELERLSGRAILVPPDLDQKQELDRSCAMLSALDAVVSAPTAVSWLAAGAGTPTLKVLYDTSWTAFGRNYEPFAPACRAMMPDAPGDWPSAFAKTLAALSAPRTTA
jgi:tetratricopeptide (TPR) repeat protein